MPVPVVPLNGELAEQSFPELLRELLRRKLDGCLTVTRGAIVRRLYLRGGMIIYGSSTERGDRLGEILIAQGKLSRADHKKFWEQSQASNRLLGSTLVVHGCISLSDLFQGVTAQVVTILDRLHRWREGSYVFEQGREPAAGTVLLLIPLALYLKTDTAKKPNAKKAAAKKTAVKKTAARATAKKRGGAAGEEQAGSVPEERAPDPAAAAEPQEQELEIQEVEADAVAPIDPEQARELERVGEVSFMVQELRKRLGQDPHTTIGVMPGAERSVVQAAFHRIAKVLHTDRLPKSCDPELVREAEEVFREVAAAFQALEDGVNRKTTGEPAAPPARPALTDEEQARRFFAQGREWISKRNYWQAADALRQAVRLKSDEAVYRQYLGLALMQIKRLPEAEEHLLEAMRLEPNNPTHLINLGRIYKTERNFKKAREVLERALRLDSRNDHARDELNDLPDQAPPARKSEGGGFLKKLFGKG